MRKAVLPALFFIGVAALVIVLISFFPKYMGSMLFLALFLMGDLALWLTGHKWIRQQSNRLRFLLTGLYWLPAITLFCLVFFGFIIPFTTWDTPIKAILLSLLLMTIVAKMIPLLISLLTWLTGLLLSVFNKPGKDWLRRIDLIAWITGGIVWLILLLGMISWAYDFKVTTVDLREARIPKAFDNFRIVQFSDLHLGNWTCPAKLREAVNDINALKPDLIVFTGDMFTFSTDESKRFDTVLKQLHAKSGIYAIMGNHDYGDYIKWESPFAKRQNLIDLGRFYSELGWNLLLNKAAVIRSGNDSINIIGVENWGATRRFQRYGNIDKAEKGINKAFFSILLSHDPSYWDSIISKKHPEIDLTLSGHTHGGQFGLENGTVRWSILSSINPYWGGLYTKNTSGFMSTLYVNRGLGTVGYAGRVGMRPEITLIILHRVRKYVQSESQH